MKLLKQISILMLVSLIFSNNLLAQAPSYQKGSYSDDFHYVEGQGSDTSSSFNNWYYAMYPQIFPADRWVSFAFNDTSNDCNYCTKLTVKKSPGTTIYYQDAEMFNNVCVAGKCSSRTEPAPSCACSFPYNQLNNSHSPYPMANSIADSAALFNLMNVNLGKVNSPYYPSDSVAYKIEMRAKAEGPTYGTRGWGFWNTQFIPTKLSPNYFAWFYEWGINFDFSDKDDPIPLVFPTAITQNDDSIYVTVLILDSYQWHDYKIIWSATTMEYYIDNILVASHNNPPSADSQHGMAFHNWVDNRLFCNGCYESKYAKLPMDKSNYIDSLNAEPVFNFIKNKSKPYSLFTESYPLSGLKENDQIKNDKNARDSMMNEIINKLMNDHGEEIINHFKTK